MALPLLALLIYKGPPLLFTLFVFVVCILALLEFFRIVSARGTSRGKTISDSGADPRSTLPLPFQALTFAFSAVIFWAAHKRSPEFILHLVTLNLLVASLLAVSRYKSNRSMLENVFRQALCMIYIPVCLSYIVLIRNGAGGIHWTFLLLSTVFAGDISAYYIGSAVGKHKLCPAVSPGKTVEGAIGGIGANLAVGSLWKLYSLPAVSWQSCVIFFLLIGLAGQIGDLFESLFKRGADVKDSGIIVPGHGGMLDRIDAVLFAAPVAYYFKEFMA